MLYMLTTNLPNVVGHMTVKRKVAGSNPDSGREVPCTLLAFVGTWGGILWKEQIWGGILGRSNENPLSTNSSKHPNLAANRRYGRTVQKILEIFSVLY